MWYQAAILTGDDAVSRHHQKATNSSTLKLPDFMGYDSMIEEEVHRFFSVFPGDAVGVGDSWERTIEVQEQDQSSKQLVTERFTMLEMPPLPPECQHEFGAGHGLCGTNRKGTARLKIESW